MINNDSIVEMYDEQGTPEKGNPNRPKPLRKGDGRKIKAQER